MFSLKLINSVLKDHKSDLTAQNLDIKDTVIQSHISKAKGRRISAADMSVEAERAKDHVKGMVATLYEAYEAALKRINALDFDDLLLYGVELFHASPRILSSCRHILVDELYVHGDHPFVIRHVSDTIPCSVSHSQDTSVLQYELVKLFAAENKSLTIVGDPDQSIYGWRQAGTPPGQKYYAIH